jgi:hypothetical protein
MQTLVVSPHDGVDGHILKRPAIRATRHLLDGKARDADAVSTRIVDERRGDRRS